MASGTETWATDIKSNRPIIGQNIGIPEGTFIELLQEALAKYSDRTQYTLTDGTSYTLKQFYDLSRSVSKSLLALGVEPFQAVSILGANSIEWFAGDVGATLAAVIPVGIYVTNKPDIVAYIVEHSDSRVFLADSELALDKFLSVKDQCPKVAKVVCWGDFDAAKYSAAHGDLVVSWKEFLALGADVADADVDARMAIPTPTSVCKLIYTSGTTGPPKAVMISHDNVYFTVKIVSKRLDAEDAHDRIVSFLPASHIAANAIDIMGALCNGMSVTFADADALRGSLVNTLKQVRPTVLLAVPRVYEKIMEKMLAVGADAGPVKKAISGWAKGVGTAAAEARDAGKSGHPLGYRVASALVFSNVKKALGLDACRLFVNAAAPMQAVTFDYFRSLDFQIADLYGMSEATGPLTVNYPEYRRGTSGKVFPGIELKLQNADKNGEGELCFRGRNMFVGYLGNDDETKAAMDDEGYVRTGDLGRVDEDGFITITGRAKELIVTAGGENVAPSLVESTLVSAMPAISRAFAIGDQKKFISAVVIPYMEDDGTLIGPAAAVNPEVKTAEEAQKDPVWQKYITAGVARANEHAVSNAAKVKKFEMLVKDFSVETGELTPKMSVKRKVVLEKLEPVIARIYGQ